MSHSPSSSSVAYDHVKESDHPIEFLPLFLMLRGGEVTWANVTATAQGISVGSTWSDLIEPEYRESWNLFWSDFCQSITSSSSASIELSLPSSASQGTAGWYTLQMSVQSSVKTPLRATVSSERLESEEGKVEVLCVLSSLRERNWRRSLLSRALCFDGFKHDLSNRIFLLSALPQLAEFSPPKELLEDLSEDLPNTLDFFSHRLSVWLTDNLDTAHPQIETPLLSGLNKAIEHLKKISYISWEIETDLDPVDPLMTDSYTLIGLFWSLHHLALTLKRAKRDVDRDEHPYTPLRVGSEDPILISLSSHHPTLGVDGARQLMSQRRGVCLSLSGGGVPWRAWRSIWCTQTAYGKRSEALFSTHSSLNVDVDRDDRASACLWMESWINAAHRAGGGLLPQLNLAQRDQVSLYLHPLS